MTLQTLIRHRAAKGASPGEIAELRAVQARMDALEVKARLFEAAQVEAWGWQLPTERLALLLSGDEAAIEQPCAPPR